MELTRLMEALTDPAAYPYPVQDVELRQTHISAVFLAGPFVYKIKKPVELGFLDFSTLEKRHHYCEAEVRLNRRLAPDVYLGVVPVSRSAAGLKLEGAGEVLEWAVKMQRLPDQASLEQLLLRGEVSGELVRALACKIADFHAHAERGEQISAGGRFEVAARNARENFEQAAAHVGVTLSASVFKRLQALTEEALARHRVLVESRAARGVPRDTHGDLHLDHVYVFPDRQPPADLVIIDCIEFTERFRFADPVADMAFLVMDLSFHGRRDLARMFAEAYFQASGDEEGQALLPFYAAYRSAVRGKVEGFKFLEKEIPQAERDAALVDARGHWLLALGELEAPRQKPCLVLVGGLPGTGKSTLARALAERAGLHLLRSDVIRKELAGLNQNDSGRAAFGEGIYTPAWTDRTYMECRRQAEELLWNGERVIVDASFGEDARRQDFLRLARQLSVPALFFQCHAEPATVRRRLDNRHGDASDADWSIYRRAAARWEEAGPATQRALQVISTDGPPEQALARALESLQERALLD